jgi:hypothetical protein
MVNKPKRCSTLLVTDTYCFLMSRYFAGKVVHNLHIWAEENPRELFPRGFQHRFSVNLWTGLLGDRLASISVVDPSIC